MHCTTVKHIQYIDRYFELIITLHQNGTQLTVSLNNYIGSITLEILDKSSGSQRGVIMFPGMHTDTPPCNQLSAFIWKLVDAQHQWYAYHTVRILEDCISSHQWVCMLRLPINSLSAWQHKYTNPFQNRNKPVFILNCINWVWLSLCRFTCKQWDTYNMWEDGSV